MGLWHCYQCTNVGYMESDEISTVETSVLFLFPGFYSCFFWTAVLFILFDKKTQRVLPGERCAMNQWWTSSGCVCVCVCPIVCAFCVPACVCAPVMSVVCEFINQPCTATVRMWVWTRSSSCRDGSVLCDLTLMTGTSVCVSVCVSVYLFVSVHALTYTRSKKDTLHADSLILLALLPADCHCSLQAGLASVFQHLLVYEVTPGPPDKLAVSQLAGTCLNASC